MTCIIGYQKDEDAWLGGDNAAVAGDQLFRLSNSKVWPNGPFLYGSAGSARMAQLLRYSFTAPEMKDGQTLVEYLTTDFIDEIRRCFAIGGFAKKVDNRERGGCFMFGVGGRLFTVYPDYQVLELSKDFASIGSGSNYALGALEVLHDEDSLSPEEKIQKALEVAEEHCSSVSAPFHIKRTP